MYGSGLNSQNGKPASFAYIASAGVFILSLLGIAFLVVGLVALASNINGTNSNYKNAEIILDENVSNGYTNLKIKINNAGYIRQMSNKINKCSNLTNIEKIFSQCNPKISTSDKHILLINTESLNFTCDNQDKLLLWSTQWIINSTTVKFDENFIIKILYSIKTCTTSKDKFINTIFHNSTVEISGVLIFVENNSIIEKEYKNCNITLYELDNSLKPCIEIKNASIPNDLKKSPTFSINEFRKNIISENETNINIYEEFSNFTNV